MSWLFGTKKKVVEVGVEPKTKTLETNEEESGFVVLDPPSYQSPLDYPTGRPLYPVLPYPLAPTTLPPSHLGISSPTNNIFIPLVQLD
jgi:hypothetical protein